MICTLTSFKHPCCAVKHALQMASDLSSLIGQQLISLPSDDSEKLIDVHASIDCNFSTKVVFEILLLNASRSIVPQQLCQALDPHSLFHECYVRVEANAAQQHRSRDVARNKGDVAVPLACS